MTDRLHSCKESPDGRHLPTLLDNVKKGVSCAYCGRRLREGSRLVEQFWQDIGRPEPGEQHV